MLITGCKKRPALGTWPALGRVTLTHPQKHAKKTVSQIATQLWNNSPTAFRSIKATHKFGKMLKSHAINNY